MTMTAGSQRVSMMTAVLVTCCASFLIQLDSIVVNVSLPTIGASLGADTPAMQWVVNCYLITFSSLLLSAGLLADRFGSKQVFAAGMAVFLIGSLLCGVAPNVALLLLARALQGVGAAAAFPASLSLLRECIEDPDVRSKAIGMWAAGGTLGLAVGPALGGVLTSWFGWQSVFFINLPFGVLGLWGLRRIRASVAHPVSFDLPGQVLGMLGIATFTFAVIESGEYGAASTQVVVSAVLCVLTAVVFRYSQRRAATVLVPADLVRNATFRGCLVVGTAINVTNFGNFFLLSLFFQDAHGLSAFSAGLLFLPLMVSLCVCNLNVHRVTKRLGARGAIVAGLAAETAGFALLVAGGGADLLWLVVLATVPIGIGVGIAGPPMMAALVAGIAPARVGLASGAVSSARMMGAAVGVAVFGLVVSVTGDVRQALWITALGATALLVTTMGVARSMLPGPAKPTEPVTAAERPGPTVAQQQSG